MSSSRSSIALSFFATLPVLAVVVAGCGGGGGGSAGPIASSSLTPPGTTFSKVARIQFSTAKTPVDSVGIDGETTAVEGGNVAQPEDIKNLILQVVEVSEGEATVLKEVSQPVPPFQGEIVVPDIPPGRHLVRLDAQDSEGRTVFGAEQFALFAPGAPTFVDFIATPVETLSSSTFTGGRIRAERFAFRLSAAQSPYTINHKITIEQGGRLLIDPGVTLDFIRQGELVVAPALEETQGGRLLAIGTAEEPIVFQRGDSSLTANNRISFFSTIPDPIRSRVSLAIVRDSAGVGVTLVGSDVSVTANRFESVGIGIFCTSTLTDGARVQSTGKVQNNVIESPSNGSGIFIRDSITEVSGNQIRGGNFGIFLERASSLVEKNRIEDASSAIAVIASTGTLVNANSIVQVSRRVGTGIVISKSNCLISQNRIRATTTSFTSGTSQPVLQAGISVAINAVTCVSGSEASDRLVLDHNSVDGFFGAGIAIIGSDPVLRFNDIRNGVDSGSSFGNAVNVDCITDDCSEILPGTAPLLPKQPLLIGNNIVNNPGKAVGSDPAIDQALGRTAGGGGVLGSTQAGGSNFVSGNAGQTGPDTTVSGTVDQVMDVTTPQIESVDAILSATAVAVAGAGAPSEIP